MNKCTPDLSCYFLQYLQTNVNVRVHEQAAPSSDCLRDMTSNDLLRCTGHDLTPGIQSKRFKGNNPNANNETSPNMRAALLRFLVRRPYLSKRGPKVREIKKRQKVQNIKVAFTNLTRTRTARKQLLFESYYVTHRTCHGTDL